MQGWFNIHRIQQGDLRAAPSIIKSPEAERTHLNITKVICNKPIANYTMREKTVSSKIWTKTGTLFSLFLFTMVLESY